MRKMVRRLRERVRDRAYAVATFHRRTTERAGVTLSIEDVTPRMRYQLCHGYEADEVGLIKSLFGPGDAVIEAGSAIGFLALYCLKVIGVRQVQMVEANPDLLPAIRRNFALNGLGAYPVLHAAVAPADGVTSFGVSRNFWASSVLDRPGAPGIRRIEVPARSLPSILAGMPERPNALIMDIEGAETSIPLDHFAPFDKIVMETHPQLAGASPTGALLDGLRSLGFREAARHGASVALAR